MLKFFGITALLCMLVAQSSRAASADDEAKEDQQTYSALILHANQNLPEVERVVFDQLQYWALAEAQNATELFTRLESFIKTTNHSWASSVIVTTIFSYNAKQGFVHEAEKSFFAGNEERKQLFAKSIEQASIYGHRNLVALLTRWYPVATPETRKVILDAFRKADNTGSLGDLLSKSNSHPLSFLKQLVEDFKSNPVLSDDAAHVLYGLKWKRGKKADLWIAEQVLEVLRSTKPVGGNYSVATALRLWSLISPRANQIPEEVRKWVGKPDKFQDLAIHAIGEVLSDEAELQRILIDVFENSGRGATEALTHVLVSKVQQPNAALEAIVVDAAKNYAKYRGYNDLVFNRLALGARPANDPLTLKLLNAAIDSGARAGLRDAWVVITRRKVSDSQVLAKAIAAQCELEKDGPEGFSFNKPILSKLGFRTTKQGPIDFKDIATISAFNALARQLPEGELRMKIEALAEEARIARCSFIASGQ